ncbi:MAG: hypothetical protein WBG50_24440, partial [Desulfomonilaceae bacterium]
EGMAHSFISLSFNPMMKNNQALTFRTGFSSFVVALPAMKVGMRGHVSCGLDVERGHADALRIIALAKQCNLHLNFCKQDRWCTGGSGNMNRIRLR